MRKVLPIILLAGGCTSVPDPAFDVSAMQAPTPGIVVQRRMLLGDPALNFVTVGEPAAVSKGAKGEEEIVQDATFRDFSMVAGTTGETMDNWWASTGALLIAESVNPL